jgi:hypothetical protein
MFLVNSHQVKKATPINIFPRMSKEEVKQSYNRISKRLAAAKFIYIVRYST